MKTPDVLRDLLACPVCRADVSAGAEAAAVRCASCGSQYPRGQYWFDFTPPESRRTGGPLWKAWEQLQANGLASYEAEPVRNLSVGTREDCQSFARFCAANGVVLDVGCGPQAWPAYFDRDAAAEFVGIDPLATLGPADYLKVTGLAEYLPFRRGAFDHVLFSTTLDHFVDPSAALAEAARVLAPGGEIDVWLGEKDATAPRPASSPEWYQRLETPAGADDVFHIKRMTADSFLEMAEGAGLAIVDEERHDIDAHRRSFFFRLRPRG